MCRNLFTECMALWMEYRAEYKLVAVHSRYFCLSLSTERRALLTEFGPLLTEFRSLFTEFSALSTELRAFLVRMQTPDDRHL